MRIFNSIIYALSHLGWFSLILLFLSAVSIPLLTFVFNIPAMQSAATRIFFFWLSGLVAALFFKAWVLNNPAKPQRRWITYISASLLLALTFYVALSNLPEISNSPFTLSWSEASRYYYASLFFSRQIYGIAVPPTVLHPSRYLMLAAPFLIPDSPIWLHRAWQVFLWIVMPLLTGGCLARRLSISDHLTRWMLVAATYIYLMVGPVYYHLLVPVILILWGFHRQSTSTSFNARLRFIVSLLVILIASAWAGISRINWFPVPGSLAAALILLEEPLQLRKSADLSITSNRGFPRASRRAIWTYILRLAGWFLFGSAIAFGAQVLYIFWSGNEAEQFTTSFSSSLLWHRLLPNATYPPGILFAAIIVSLPLALAALGRLLESCSGRARWLGYHPLRLMGLASILAVFFAGGVIVSLKIGGGSNIHNLDAYMVILLIVCAYFVFEQAKPDLESPHLPPSTIVEGNKPAPTPLLINLGLAFALLVFSFSSLVTRRPASASPNAQEAAQSLAVINRSALEASQKSGEVLFLSNRQLVTFHYINVPLVPDYERVFLMEAAMAGDPIYLGRLYDDLKNRRFALIVSEPLSREEKGPKDDFGAENNAWMKNVSRHVLCYYEPSRTLRDVQVQLLSPTTIPKKNCP